MRRTSRSTRPNSMPVFGKAGATSMIDGSAGELPLRSSVEESVAPSESEEKSGSGASSNPKSSRESCSSFRDNPDPPWGLSTAARDAMPLDDGMGINGAGATGRTRCGNAAGAGSVAVREGYATTCAAGTGAEVGAVSCEPGPLVRCLATGLSLRRKSCCQSYSVAG